MEEYYEKVIEEVKSWIKAGNTEDLLTDTFFDKVYSQNKLDAPYLDKENSSVHIDSQVMSFNNVPPGIRFVPGDKMDYASFGFPIKGDVNLFQNRIRFLIKNNPLIFRVVNNVFYIKEFSERPLINNESAIEAIKAAAKQKVHNVIQSLEELKGEVDSFNQGRLTHEIRALAKAELEKRNQKDDTLEKLKLF